MICIKRFIVLFIVLCFTIYTFSYSLYKQIFHAFLFNVRNYSPKVINIQRRDAELNIILPRVNNFDIKQKRHGIFVLLYATDTKQDLRR